MDTWVGEQGDLSPWGRSLKLARAADGRERVWKAPLEAERKAKQDGTYDQLPDVSKAYVQDGKEEGNQNIRPCDF